MIETTSRTRPIALPFAAFSTAAVGVLAIALAVAGPAQAASPPDVLLRTTTQFAVLASDGITNTGPTTLTGDIGSAPTTSIADNGVITTTGVIRTGPDQVVADAKADLLLAIGQASGAQPATVAIPADIGGQTLVGGTYKQASSLGLTGTVILDGQNDPDSVFIIQVGQDFTTAPGASVTLTRGAQACHVYWQIGNSAVFDTTTSFKGNVLAYQDISAKTGAIFEGRLLTSDGAVTLDTNTVTLPACTPVVTPSTSTPTATSSTSTGAPTTATPTPQPTNTGSTGGGGGGDSDADSDGGADADSDGGDYTGGGGSGSGISTRQDIPDTGGPSRLLAPLGGIAVVAGVALVIANRRRRGSHRV